MVRVDWPMKAPSMHIQKPYWEKMSMFSQLSLCQKKNLKQTPSYICSLCLYCICKYQIAPLNSVVEVDRPMKVPSKHIQKPY